MTAVAGIPVYTSKFQSGPEFYYYGTVLPRQGEAFLYDHKEYVVREILHRTSDPTIDDRNFKYVRGGSEIWLEEKKKD